MVTIWARVVFTALPMKADTLSVAVLLMPVAVVDMPSVTVWADTAVMAVCPTTMICPMPVEAEAATVAVTAVTMASII